MGITYDASEFLQGLKRLQEKALPDEKDRALYKAGNAALRDAIYEKPFCPFGETGMLRGSARTQTPDGVMRKMTKTESAAFSDTGKEGNNELTIGFNISYAARWHELSPSEDSRINWSLPGSGRKYLESKLIRNGPRYLKIMGESLKRAFTARI